MARLQLAGALGAIALGAGAMAQTAWLRYDAAVGTLPTSQGFIVRDDGRGAAPAVVGGELRMGPTDFSTVQVYSAGQAMDFSQGVVVEAEIKVASSTFNVNDCASGIRSGYYAGVVDGQGRFAYFALGSSQLAILTSTAQMPSAETPVFAAPLRDQWRTLKMVIREHGIDVFMDGNYVGHSALGPAGQSRDRNRFLFGDGTGCGSSQTSLRWVQVGPYVPCPADFNEDGFVDMLDYDDFVACFEGIVCPPNRTADINGDGFVDMFDYDDFVAAFESGCGGSPSEPGNDPPGGGIGS